MEYCLSEPNLNLFILGDIENFGFENDFQEVWFQTIEARLTGIVLRYHDNLIVYSRDLDMDFHEVLALLETRKVRILSGKQTVMDGLYPFLANQFSKREMNFCELQDSSKLVNVTAAVQVAGPADALEIAEVYGKINEFAGLYASEQDTRQRQIANRISSREGVHLFIRRDGNIVSHANSAAETSVSGMIGGILTLPEYRHQGLASQVISAVCQDLAQRGKSACLFYDNNGAHDLFQGLGFQVSNKWTILEKGMNE